MIRTAILVLGFSSFVFAASGKHLLPKEVRRCRRSDSNFDNCLLEAIQDSVPVFEKGLPRLGIFPIDPLKFEALDIGKGTGPVKVDLKFKDFNLKGLRNVKIRNVKSDLDNYTMRIDGYFDQPIDIDSDYTLAGNVLVLPLVGNGTCHLSLDQVQASITLKGTPFVDEDGVVYMHLDSLIFELDTTQLHMHFDNLFSENEEIGENLNNFLNENWKEIFDELSPAIKEAMEVAFKEVATRLLSKIPFNEIFLP